MPRMSVHPQWLRKLRIHLCYLWRHNRVLRLHTPSRFTELVQQRKLTDRSMRMPLLIDKIAVKNFVERSLGNTWVTPTLWSGDVLPDAPSWPVPFVVKSRHGCNQYRVVRDTNADWSEIRRASADWMRSSYGQWLDEWAYSEVPRGLLVEPFIGEGPDLPIDYKFYVFHGRVAAVQVHLGRETEHRWMLLDRDWRRLSSAGSDPDPAVPCGFDRMIAGAEVLASGIDFVRVDFYETGDTPRFGEMTFYPGSGLDPFRPDSLDDALGRLWRGRGAVQSNAEGHRRTNDRKLLAG